MDNTLLTNALIYLAAAVIAVPVAKRLGLGAILGYLIGGILIGPWGLGLIQDVDDVLHISEFGVVLLLFLIGMELDPSRLRALRRPVFGWGGMQVLGCTLALFCAALLLGADWKLALVAALGLSLSSTAIVLATIDERHLKATPAGDAGFAIMLFQDIAAIPMIALIPFLGAGALDGDGEGWLGALKVAGVMLLLVFSGRHLVRPLLRLVAQTGVREIFTSFALLLVIAIAVLMQWVGISMALGTFLAGVLLADSEYRHALESDLEPFKGLLLGLFFIAVGMSVDFGLLLRDPLLVIGLACGFLLLKAAILWGLARVVRIPPGEQLLFAVLLAQGGEFAFVLFGSAAAARVFPAETASLLVVVVALSMVLTPLLLLAYDRLVAPGLHAARRKDDAIPPQDNTVIIAGFGRFGQIIGRLLLANRIRATVLDHDPEQVDLLRKFGLKVFYGDATRIDLLRNAGAERARVLVVAIDDIEASLDLVDRVRVAFPNLTIVARARNVTHYYDLMDRGVTILERETFEASLLLGGRVLQELGFSQARAGEVVCKFREHNIRTLHKLYPYYKDQAQMISMAKQGRKELEDMFASDNAALREEAEKPVGPG
ncbi:glutathione-regulated potassium-efflux system protein KefC [Noviherbaspirillum aridicola]|uniref:Glutathione-regulated potassium-efflux system protein KefC n=1 Tax=Noviherbaspirillum aridicola TaxID=2849687 RepID=A0ABQ4Q108_9BURK|nr:glutathione-regulated potassium-efflux system protein KefC [Noviherbaspirillum aridicola]GIZ50449.1 glutathione-regulated potassium-efflux system protein KefC [Noviherbaspirillum aridicola]